MSIWQRFDEDRVGQLLADPQPRVADLANVIRIARHQRDLLLLAKPKFSQPIGELRAGGELFDRDGGPRLDPAQGTHLRAGALAFNNEENRFLFHRGPK